jgi:ABC-type nitrate/sulfonate/bicarbonate transport system ATPase subunit
MQPLNTPGEVARYDRLSLILAALIEKRVSTTTVIGPTGTGKGTALQIVADAKAILAESEK